MPVNHGGLHIFGGHPLLVPGHDTGREFFVGNSATYVPGGVAGVDDPSHGDSPQRPFATIDYAIGQCTGSRGDVLNVLPGHAETVAGTIAADVAGVKIRGLGVGQNRPTLTFDTTTDVLAISAANIEVTGLIFVCNVASHVDFITLAGGADGAWIHHNLFREGSATGLSMIEWTGAADDVVIEDNQFYAPTAGNYDEAILIASTPTRGIIRRNVIFGDWDEGGINNATGNVATLFLISDNDVTNLLTNVPAINLDSAVTGMLSNNRLSTDTYSTALDAGAMRANGNLWASVSGGTTDVAGIPIPTFPAAGDSFIPGLGYRVTDSTNMASTAENMFAVTGKVLMTLLIGEVTTSLSTSTSIQVRGSVAAKNLCAATSLTAAGIAVGTMFLLTGDGDDVLNGSAGGYDQGTNISHTTQIPVVLDGETLVTSIATAGTGVILWELYYLPLEASASVAAA